MHYQVIKKEQGCGWRAMFRLSRDTCFVNRDSRSGMTILLVILVLSGLLAISIGIFNVVFLETQIAGEITGSMRAIYIAEQGLERTLYLDLDNGASSPICTPGAPTNSCTFTFDASTGGDFQNADGACFRAIILKRVSPAAPCDGPSGNHFNCIASTGTYNCSSSGSIKRSTGFNY